LKEIFPEAKFLHIIRDPRDCCLSANKAWGTNIYRTAELWRQRLEIGRSDGYQLGDDYMEVLYENLLDEPEKTMISVCTFLGCNFITVMTELSKPADSLGDTKGQTRIVKQNKNKYLFELSPYEIRRIEEIVYPIAKNIPYNFEYDVESKPLGYLMFKILTFYDGVAWLRFYIHKKDFSGIMHWYRTVMHILAGRMSLV
ncbi:MAG TPA: sulfotransferase, partial [bacterium]|nr:sulfotransferase [bacterium]